MKKQKHSECIWAEEVERKGWQKFLKEKIESRRKILISELIKFTGCCRNTVLRHVRRFVSDNSAVAWKNQACLDTAMLQLQRPH